MIKLRKKDQNIIDFVTQHYGDPDQVLSFLSLNETQWDYFGESGSTNYKVDDTVGNIITTFYTQEKIDVVSGLDTSSYIVGNDFNNDFNSDFAIVAKTLFKAASYYSGTTTVPPISDGSATDPNVFYEAFFSDTGDTEGWVSYDDGLTTVITRGGQLEIIPLAAGYCYAANTTSLSGLETGTYKFTIDANWDGSVQGLFILGGYWDAGGTGDKNWTYFSQGRNEFTLELEADDADVREDSMLLWWISTTPTVYVNYMKIEKIS